MRRLDVEEVLEQAPMPDIGTGKFLVDILFQVGPTKADGPLEESALEPWERRRGIELLPWHADAILTMSRAYMAESHAAKSVSAPPPWPPAVRMWQWVQGKKAESAAKRAKEAAQRAAEMKTKEQSRNGNRK